MSHHTLKAKQIAGYTQFLRREERAAATVEKYSRDILVFASWLRDRLVTKETVTRMKRIYKEAGVEPSNVFLHNLCHPYVKRATKHFLLIFKEIFYIVPIAANP